MEGRFSDAEFLLLSDQKAFLEELNRKLKDRVAELTRERDGVRSARDKLSRQLAEALSEVLLCVCLTL